MELAPRLIEIAVPRRAEGAVIVLHGGASRRGSPAVSPAQLSVLRMVPIARRLAVAGRGRLAVYRLLNSHRGWDASHTPVQDAHWALDQLGGELPVCLVGHSLGGRAAILAAARPEVRGAAALAPYVYPQDLPAGRPHARFLFVHGSEDRVASPARSRALAERLAQRAEVEYVTVEGGRHAMLRHGGRFTGLAARFTTETLLGESGARRRRGRSASTVQLADRS